MTSGFSKDPFHRISQEKRDRIIEAATVEFAERGFASANINRMAQSAGISIGAMYKYFGSKDDLFLAIVQHGVEKIKSVLGGIMRSEEELICRIDKIIRAIQTHSRENVHLTKLYNVMATESRSDLVWKIASEMEGVSAGLYTAIIREAQEAGILRADMDPGLFAFFLDNLFMMLQFSYASDYYRERLKIFAGADVTDRDDLVAEQLLKFIGGAFQHNSFG